MKLKCIVICLLFSFCSNLQADSISIRADEWFPMNGAPGAAQPGYMIELAEKIFASNDHSIDYKVMPWERALDKVRTGDFNCVVGAYKEDAPGFIFPQEQWGMDDTAFYVSADSKLKLADLNALLKYKVGVVQGYAYGGELDVLITNSPAVFKSIGGKDALDKNIKKLLNNRLDVVLESVAVMEAKLKQMGASDKVTVGGALDQPTEMYIACSPNHPKSKDYIQMIDEGTKKLRASGELAKILDKYGLKDWK